MPVQRPYHHGNLRDAVRDAARVMVSTDGTAGVSLRALAREVGVSHPAIYNHFADREALLAELSTEALLAMVHGYTVLAIDGRLTEGTLSVSGAGYAPMVRTLSRAVRLLYAGE